jgi:hypothetical protein
MGRARTCRWRRWWRRVGEARGRRAPTPSPPPRERMPFRRLPSALSGGSGHHAIAAAGDGAAAIPSSGRGRERVIGVREEWRGGPAPRIYFSLYSVLSLSLSSPFGTRFATCTRARCEANQGIRTSRSTKGPQGD